MKMANILMALDQMAMVATADRDIVATLTRANAELMATKINKPTGTSHSHDPSVGGNGWENGDWENKRRRSRGTSASTA